MLMRSEVKHLNVPAQQLKLGRSKSLNTTRSGCYSMNLRPKRTYSLPNREKLTLPHITQPEEEDRFEEEYSLSDRDIDRAHAYSTNSHELSTQNEVFEPLFGFLISLIFLIWSWFIDAFLE